MKKFPKLIHVTREEQANDEPFLQVNEGGAFEAAEAGKSKPCAVYKLVTVGMVVAPPKFVPRAQARRLK